MFDTTQDHLKSTFDSGLSIIYRIDSLRKIMHISKFKKDHEGYFWSLVSLFVELSRSMSEDEKEEHIGHYKGVRENYFKIKQAKDKVNFNLLESFVMWELELTEIEQKYNYGMPKKGDPRFAMAGGRV